MSLKKFNLLGILIDNPDSWMWSYIEKLQNILTGHSEQVETYNDKADVKECDILFILSCDKILKSEDLRKSRNNIVVHESDLPQGRGWSPLSWQVERGENSIPITLFEAQEELDSGDWYLKGKIELTGYELIDEIREKQFIKTSEMIEQYLIGYPMINKKQKGEPTFFTKRTAKNQTLDINKSINEQFNRLRVCDNSRYPAHFELDGNEYIVKIFKK